MCRHTTPKEHKQLRTELSTHVRQFLRGGGKITRIPTGVSADTLSGKSYSQISRAKKRGKASLAHEQRLKRAVLGRVA